MTDTQITEMLNKNFTLVAKQVNEITKRGYRLNFNASGNYSRLGVKHINVQLCGINPLTGLDVEDNHIVETFSFEKKINKTEVLTYHGKFILRCTAYMEDGRVIPFREQPITLNFPKNIPYLKYTTSSKGGFTLITMESNCWNNCTGKIWLKYEGHYQRLSLPTIANKPLRFYVPAAGDVSIQVQDDTIQVTNGR